MKNFLGILILLLSFSGPSTEGNHETLIEGQNTSILMAFPTLNSIKTGENKIFQRLAIHVSEGREPMGDDLETDFRCLSNSDRSLLISLAIIYDRCPLFDYFRDWGVTSQINENVLEDPRIAEFLPIPNLKTKLLLKQRVRFPTYPIHFAIALGRGLRFIAKLVNSTGGASLDVHDLARGWTPLHYAVAFDHNRIILQYLLYDLKYNPWSMTLNNDNPLNILQLAVKEDENVETIIEWISDLILVNAADSKSTYNSITVKCKIQKMILAKCKESPNLSVIHLAAQKGSMAFVNFYSQFLDLNIVDENGWGILHHAAFHNQAQVIEYFVTEFPANFKILKAMRSTGAVVEDDLKPGLTAYNIAVLKHGRGSDSAHLLKDCKLFWDFYRK